MIPPNLDYSALPIVNRQQDHTILSSSSPYTKHICIPKRQELIKIHKGVHIDLVMAKNQ